VTDIRISQTIQLPPALAHQTAAEILREIARQERPWQGFALHLDLGDIGLPDVGYVAVPVRIEVSANPPEAENQIDFSIVAIRHSSAFPKFQGALGADAIGPAAATLWLGGTYDVPLSGLGKLVDVTLARGAAEKSLKNFLGDIVRACEARVNKREAELMRYRTFDIGT
jgi:hypothetical protein